MYITDKSGKRYAAVDRICIDCGEKKLVRKHSFRERCRQCSFIQRPNSIKEDEKFIIVRGKKNRAIKFTCRVCNTDKLCTSIELKRNKSGMCRNCANKEQKGCAWVPGFVKQQRRSNCVGKEHQGYKTGLGIYQRICKEKYGNSCIACKSKKNIHVHHIDCNRKNNEEYNLIPLCCSCHMLVHWKIKKGFSHEKAIDMICSEKKKG